MQKSYKRMECNTLQRASCSSLLLSGSAGTAKAQKCAAVGVGHLDTTSHVKGLIGHEQDKRVYGARIGNSANAAICSPV